jgi:hypothetical protein
MRQPLDGKSRRNQSTKAINLRKPMGSTNFDDAAPAIAGPTSSRDIVSARGSNGCAMASNRVEHDDVSPSRHRARIILWRMIFAENRRPLFGIMR